MDQNKALTNVDDPMAPVPIPEQVPVKEGIAELAGTRLGYWDIGGGGTPVVFFHPASGRALILTACSEIAAKNAWAAA